MAVEVDQSGRVEDLSTGTAIAFSNGESASVFISAGAKRRLIVFLRRNSLIPTKDLPAVIFSILVYPLMAEYRIEVLKIDEEYTGKNLIIEETIKKLYARHRIKRIPDVRFVRIGKQAAAHKLAWKVHRSKGRLAGVRKILEKEILGKILWKGKEK